MSITRDQLQARAESIADQPASTTTTFVTATQAADYVNDAIRALYDDIIKVHPDFKVTIGTAFNITNVQANFQAVPADFRSVRAVVSDPATSLRDFLPRYAIRAGATSDRLSYRLQGSSLYVEPQYSSIGQFQLYYTPTAPILANGTDTLDVELEQFQDAIYLKAAIFMILKNEWDPKDKMVLYTDARSRVLEWASTQRSADPPSVEDVRSAPRRSIAWSQSVGGVSLASMVEFSAVGAFTATIPAGAAFVMIDGWGGGGGGGSGGVGVAGTVGGGGGGGSGGRSTTVFPRTAFGPTIAGIVGAGGTGGAGQTTDNTAGTVGASGIATTVGTIFSAGAGSGGGAGGTAAAGSGGAAGTGGTNGGAGGTAGAGGVGNTGTQAVTTSAGGAGGGGGGTNQLGGIGGQGSTITTQGSVSTIFVAAGAAGAISGAGGNGATVITGVSTATGGGGGGGGGGGNAANGGIGGNGSLLSAGGGGSGAAANGFDSAKGGDGAPGKIVFFFY